MLLCASSPCARRGVLYQAYKKHFGKDGSPVLVWKAATRLMNPSVPQQFIDDALADDPAHATAEYMAEFRTDVEAFVSIEAVEAVTSTGVRMDITTLVDALEAAETAVVEAEKQALEDDFQARVAHAKKLVAELKKASTQADAEMAALAKTLEWRASVITALAATRCVYSGVIKNLTRMTVIRNALWHSGLGAHLGGEHSTGWQREPLAKADAIRPDLIGVKSSAPMPARSVVEDERVEAILP